MSTYNSKFSGAKIDEILGKAEELATLHEAGQLGGGGSGVSEKEAFAKELGATHKHTITLDIGTMGSVRCVTYTKDATPFTVETLTSAMIKSSYLNAYGIFAATGVFAMVDGYFAVSEDGGEQALVLAMNGIFRHYEFVNSVDFTNQSTNSIPTTIQAFDGALAVSMLIEHAGAIFTDTVTEL